MSERIFGTSWRFEQRVAGLLNPRRRRETKLARLAAMLLAAGFCMCAAAASRAAQNGTTVVNDQQNADAITDATPASEAEVLLRKVLDRSQYWAGRRSESLKSLSYDYELNGRRQSIKLVNEISRVPRSQWEEATLNSGMPLLTANASAFSVTLEDIKPDTSSGEDIVRLTCRRKDQAQSLSVAFGNGVDGTWSGYFSHGAKEIVLGHESPVPYT